MDDYTATRLIADDTITRPPSMEVEFRNERVRQSHTWREPGGSTNLSISDSVQLEPGRDKSASEVATLPPG